MYPHKDILVVDDEPGFRTLINRRLKIAGYHVHLAQNAHEALVALWEKEQIGLVLLDIRLPVINGLNIFEIIRKDFPDKKIIITSVFPKDEQRFLLYEADDYFEKSEDLSKLIAMVDNVLNHTLKAVIRENEKRSFKRIPVSVLASCDQGHYDAVGPRTHFISYTKDLSPWGGKFIVGEDVKIGQHFTMALELPVNFMPLLIECEVVWVRKSKEIDSPIKGKIEAGIRFAKINSPIDEEKLKNYLNCV